MREGALACSCTKLLNTEMKRKTSRYTEAPYLGDIDQAVYPVPERISMDGALSSRDGCPERRAAISIQIVDSF